jgi:hypothetical protein
MFNLLLQKYFFVSKVARSKNGGGNFKKSLKIFFIKIKKMKNEK